MAKYLARLVLVALVAWGTTAMAENVYAPPWEGIPGVPTHQEWDARDNDGLWPAPYPLPQGEEWPPLPEGVPIDPNPEMPLENPFGIPLVTLFGMENSVQIVDGPRTNPDGTPIPIPTWHIGAGGGSIEIYVPNSPSPNERKKIFVQVTADKSVTPTADPPTVEPVPPIPGSTSSNLPAPYPHVQWDGTWYTYNFLMEITPNPEGEVIKFDGLVESTNISEIVVDTICTPVPEPTTLIMLVLSGAGMLACCWRKRC